MEKSGYCPIFSIKFTCLWWTSYFIPLWGKIFNFSIDNPEIRGII
nr:MAG TPA: Protease NS2-3 C virus, NS2 domain [Caudoviricetes sp.]